MCGVSWQNVSRWVIGRIANRKLARYWRSIVVWKLKCFNSIVTWENPQYSFNMSTPRDSQSLCQLRTRQRRLELRNVRILENSSWVASLCGSVLIKNIKIECHILFVAKTNLLRDLDVNITGSGDLLESQVAYTYLSALVMHHRDRLIVCVTWLQEPAQSITKCNIAILHTYQCQRFKLNIIF